MWLISWNPGEIIRRLSGRGDTYLGGHLRPFVCQDLLIIRSHHGYHIWRFDFHLVKWGNHVLTRWCRTEESRKYVNFSDKLTFWGYYIFTSQQRYTSNCTDAWYRHWACQAGLLWGKHLQTTVHKENLLYFQACSHYIPRWTFPFSLMFENWLYHS